MLKKISVSLCFGILLFYAFGCSKHKSEIVTVEMKSGYVDISLDYRSNPSPHDVGFLLGKKLLQTIPDYEAVLETFITSLSKAQYDDYMAKSKQIIPQIPGAYRLELDGLSEALSGGSMNVSGDRKISKDELYLINLYVDLRGGECCAFAALPQQSTTGRTSAARLLDWPYFEQISKLHSVTHIKMKSGEMTSVGFAGIQGVLSGVNSRDLFAAILYAHTKTPYMITAPHSILFDLRICLELQMKMQDLTAYVTKSSTLYPLNHIIFTADPALSGIIENDFTPPSAGAPSVRAFRTDMSELNPGIEWNLPGRVATVNAFVLKGTFNNFTGVPYNEKRWGSIRRLLDVTGKLSPENLKSAILYFGGKAPGQSADGDVYDAETEQIILYEPGTLRIFFRQYGQPLPLQPDFITVTYPHG